MAPGAEGVVGYKWTSLNHYIMRSSRNQVAMGGGGEGFGFVCDADFLDGQSNR